MLRERLLSFLLELGAAGDVITHGMKGEKMKKWIVVSGVLAVFLFAAFAAYAAENSTWGRIKVTFEDSAAEELPAVAAKTMGGENDGEFQPVRFVEPMPEISVTEFISVKNGGKLEIKHKGTKITLKFKKNSVPGDTEITLTMLESDALDFRITPPMELNKPAELTVKGSFILPQGKIALCFDDDEEGWIKVGDADVKEKKDKIEIRGKFGVLLNHFSRYAFGTRW